MKDCVISKWLVLCCVINAHSVIHILNHHHVCPCRWVTQPFIENSIHTVQTDPCMTPAHYICYDFMILPENNKKHPSLTSFLIYLVDFMQHMDVPRCILGKVARMWPPCLPELRACAVWCKQGLLYVHTLDTVGSMMIRWPSLSPPSWLDCPPSTLTNTTHSFLSLLMTSLKVNKAWPELKVWGEQRLFL